MINKQSNSYGIVPLLEMNNRVYALFQCSFSSDLLDLKLDPFRGKQQLKPLFESKNNHHEYIQSPQQPDTRSVSSTHKSIMYESEIDTAVRETYEESKHVLNFASVSHLLESDSKYNGLYYIKIVFGEEHGKTVEEDVATSSSDISNITTAPPTSTSVMDLLSAYDHNSSMIDSIETVGLVFYNSDEIYSNNIRLASQARNCLTVIDTKLDLDRVPTVVLNRQVKHGFITYTANEINQNNSTNSGTTIIASSSDLCTKIVNNDEEIKKLQIEHIKSKLELYPGDFMAVSKVIKKEAYLQHLIDNQEIETALQNAEEIEENKGKKHKKTSKTEGSDRTKQTDNIRKGNNKSHTKNSTNTSNNNTKPTMIPKQQAPTHGQPSQPSEKVTNNKSTPVIRNTKATNPRKNNNVN